MHEIEVMDVVNCSETGFGPTAKRNAKRCVRLPL